MIDAATRGAMRRSLLALARAWNWKSALSSSIARALLFFFANLSAGLHPAIAAAQTEFLYRAVAAGFYGSLTEHFSRRHASRGATIGAMIVVPGVAHLVELAVHHASGTPRLGTALLMSIAFSLATTRFNLFAMRRGLLLGNQSLRADVRALSSLAAAALDRARRTAVGWRRARYSTRCQN